MGRKGKQTGEAGSAKTKRGKTKTTPSKAQAKDGGDGPEPGAAAPTAPSQSAAIPHTSNVQEPVQGQVQNTAPTRKRKATEQAGPAKPKKPRPKPQSPGPGPRPGDDTAADSTAPRTARPRPTAAQPASKVQATTQAQTQSGATVQTYGVEGQTLEHQIDLELRARIHASESASRYREQVTLAYPEQVYTDSGGRPAAHVNRDIQERAIARFEQWLKDEEERKKAKTDASDNQVTGSTPTGAEKSRGGARKKGGAKQKEAAKEAEGARETEGENQAGTKENAGGQNDDRSAGTGGHEKLPDPKQKPPQKVWIVVDPQEFHTLYGKDFGDTKFGYDAIHRYTVKETTRLPRDGEGLDRETLMKCSREAYDFFMREPTATELHLPIKYPDTYYGEAILGEQVAYIRHEEIENYIIPWLEQVEEWRKNNDEKHKEKKGKGSHHKKKKASSPPAPAQSPDHPPSIPTPNDLVGKIHLYNTMLQLGIPRKLQHTLVQKLCKEISSSKLTPNGKGYQRDSHLDLLEITIGRLNSRTVAVLDPILSTLAGSFGLRGQEEIDLTLPARGPTARLNMENDDSNNVPQGMIDRPGLLNYGLIQVQRTNQTNQQPLPNDTIIRPPELPVIGHSLRNWSGIRRIGDYRPAHTGYPLYIGELVYYNREDRFSNAGQGRADDVNPDIDRTRFVGGLGEFERRDYLRARSNS